MNQNNNNQLRSGYDKPLSVRQFITQTSVKIETPKKPVIFQKHIVTLFASLAALIMFVLRYNLSIAIISMADEKIIDTSNNTENSTDINYIYRFNWHHDEKTQGIILSSYFYGYTAFQVPAGRMAEKFGAKWVIGMGVFISGLFTFLTPLAADLGLPFFIVCRLLIGILHSTILTTCYTLFNTWIPEKEKVRAVTWINVAFEIGGMSTLYLSGLICASPALGWEYAFYLLGCFAFIWFVPYCFLVYSEPSQNPRLTNYERKKLEESKALKQSEVEFSAKFVKVAPKFDLKKIFKSKAVWASCIAKFTSNFGYYLLSLKMSAYLKEVFNVPLAQNGLLSALPYLGVLTSKLICLKLAGYLQKKDLMSLTNLRKTFQFFAMGIPAICFLVIALKGDNQIIVSVLIFIGMFGHGLQCGGDAPIVNEFARDLSGSIFGLTNMFACIDGILAPFLVAFAIVSFDNLISAWNSIFYFASFLYVIGLICFLILASAEPQPWAISTFKEVDPATYNGKKRKQNQSSA